MSNAPTIEALKYTITLESVVGAVVELKNGKGLCPFHADRNPSFSIKGNRFRCFACGESGDVIDFVKKYYGLGTGEAIKYLADRAGFKLSRPAPARIAEDREKRELVAAFRAWEAETRNEIAKALRRYRHYWATHTGSFSERELETLAMLQGDFDYLEYLYDILCGRDDFEKYALFKEELGYGD